MIQQAKPHMIRKIDREKFKVRLRTILCADGKRTTLILLLWVQVEFLYVDLMKPNFFAVQLDRIFLLDKDLF